MQQQTSYPYNVDPRLSNKISTYIARTIPAAKYWNTCLFSIPYGFRWRYSELASKISISVVISSSFSELITTQSRISHGVTANSLYLRYILQYLWLSWSWAEFKSVTVMTSVWVVRSDGWCIIGGGGGGLRGLDWKFTILLAWCRLLRQIPQRTQLAHHSADSESWHQTIGQIMDCAWKGTYSLYSAYTASSI